MADQAATAPGAGTRMWGVMLNPGIGKLNLLTFFLACFTSIMLAAFVPQAQPFILAEIMQVPEGETGRLSGNLNFVGELVIIASVTFWGVLSDRLGRLTVTVAGYLFIAASMGFYAVADSFIDLMMARIVYSVGIA